MDTDELSDFTQAELEDLEARLTREKAKRKSQRETESRQLLLHEGVVVAIACPTCKGSGGVEVETIGSDNTDVDYFTEPCDECEEGVVYGVPWSRRERYQEAEALFRLIQ